MNKLDGITAARSFAETYYRDCVAALLCGSVARGEATLNSDLDILIVIEGEGPFHRRTYRHHGWFVEAFVAPRTFYEAKILQRSNNRNPSLLRSFAEAMILKDHTNFAQNLKEKAIETLEQGPAPSQRRRETNTGTSSQTGSMILEIRTHMVRHYSLRLS
jgi:hypothetical protein